MEADDLKTDGVMFMELSLTFDDGKVFRSETIKEKILTAL
ncbi:hypothetical protein CHY_1673 [Carboxydothermus hydrogenoformans Z-2901]|uniref:Uncharacterized protein n=1 Tax=Carboxydothermus hydrogenoformans (strain ATCC BAA-161 / DSM 6008 / Z-2901) TaxID=246194 RepID=Q3ABJ1_CARHZ|nr:hypothetical protein CHY_1673 [Carboxydothermus hydrogenoformans Z-2901]